MTRIYCHDDALYPHPETGLRWCRTCRARAKLLAHPCEDCGGFAPSGGPYCRRCEERGQIQAPTKSPPEVERGDSPTKGETDG